MHFSFSHSDLKPKCIYSFPLVTCTHTHTHTLYEYMRHHPFAERTLLALLPHGTHLTVSHKRPNGSGWETATNARNSNVDDNNNNNDKDNNNNNTQMESKRENATATKQRATRKKIINIRGTCRIRIREREIVVTMHLVDCYQIDGRFS